ncbi:SUMF1/EgtB/PvdO family nonheme iron enzyme [Candidatus Uabimicrobium amorphum]|uniref:Sulfatase-modifying factor enzyme-like domain-containing protein n=1 Tax=Uabimicrobium amorphum TaxID=2596890 RepID=A0A5S9IL42_UABAM|nr:SUMF1/EgtB/PvdO family nonheme iron enzyme [Candidatus Uabimicrobium amorphum]BBM83873.1 hypothetical protein UABAM_02228 [Candidatus Uabimicrobium amorphum]
MTRKIAIVGTIALVAVTATFLAKERLYSHREDMEEQWKQVSDEVQSRKAHLKNIKAQIRGLDVEITTIQESISTAKNNQVVTNNTTVQPTVQENKKVVEETNVVKENIVSDTKKEILPKKPLIERLRVKIEEAKEEQQEVPIFLEGYTYEGIREYTCARVTNAVHEYRHTKTGVVFALIEDGEFRMGSRRRAESPIHTVELSAYLMTKYEITQGVWTEIMGENPSKIKGRKHPVENITWNQAHTFCKDLGWSLPSEAQWEYAYYAGSKRRPFFWGDKYNGKYSWTRHNAGKGHHAVGTRKSNAFGLHDMAGNVIEWCADTYSLYEEEYEINPVVRRKKGAKVMRGSSWFISPQSGTKRHKRPAHIPDNFVGFRCVKNLSPEQQQQWQNFKALSEEEEHRDERREDRLDERDEDHLDEHPDEHIDEEHRDDNVIKRGLDILDDVFELVEGNVLDLANRNINNAQLKMIFTRSKGILGVKVLNLENTKITSKSLVHICRLRNLTSLNLAGTKITDGYLGRLKFLPHLQELDLSETHISGKALEKLPKMQKLHYLNVSANNIGDEYLAHLEKFPKLYYLGMRYCRITDEGVQQIPHLKRLAELDLRDNKIEGHTIEQIFGMPLKNLNLLGNELLTPEIIELLDRGLPHCTIEHESLK